MGMGYSGYVKIMAAGTNLGSDLVVLATGAGVNLVLEPITSGAVWGAGWYNAGRPSHYADGGLRYEGSVDIELQGISNLWSQLDEFAITRRAYSKSLEISPDGAKIYRYQSSGPTTYDNNGAWCQSMSISTSEGSFVTVSLGVVAIFRSEVYGSTYIGNPTGELASTCSVIEGTNPLNPDGYNSNPIAFWRTAADLLVDSGGGYVVPKRSGGAESETVEWSVDLANNTIVLYTMNGDRLPTAVLQGPIDVTGSTVIYNPDGVWDPVSGPNEGGGGYNETNPFSYAANTRFVVYMDIDNSGGQFQIWLPYVFINSDDYSLPGQDSITNRSFGLTAMGGHCFDPPSGTVSYVQPPMLLAEV